jgi:MFS family permease
MEAVSSVGKKEQALTNWKANLIVLWLGQFMVMSGMSMVIPFLPLFIQEMGVTDPGHVAVWAGIIFAANFITAFLFQPYWGKVADRHGRKIMILRSGFGMALVNILMGFSGTPWHLLLLRILNGTISGFVPAATALISTNTPRDKTGLAMGILQSGAVGGSILGPFFGGLLADWVGFRTIFFITGSLIFLATLLAAFLVRESFDAEAAAKQKQLSLFKGYQELRRIPQMPALFTVTLLIQFSILSSMPQIPLFIQEMHGNMEMLAFYAGLVGSVTGFSNMLASPFLGRMGDRIGSERILVISLIGAAAAFLPQAFVHSIWQLLIARFVLGLFMGGLLPSVNALIRQFTPSGMESRAYGYNQSFLAMGNMAGPTIGGLLSAWFGIRVIFILSAILLLINALWVRKTLFGAKREHMPQD